MWSVERIFVSIIAMGVSISCYDHTASMNLLLGGIALYQWSSMPSASSFDHFESLRMGLKTILRTDSSFDTNVIRTKY
jgi:hypothetical protein